MRAYRDVTRYSNRDIRTVNYIRNAMPASRAETFIDSIRPVSNGFNIVFGVTVYLTGGGFFLIEKIIGATRHREVRVVKEVHHDRDMSSGSRLVAVSDRRLRRGAGADRLPELVALTTRYHTDLS